MKLRNNIWRPRTGDAFRIGRRSPSAPDADLADIMRMDGIASGYSARSMLGRHYLQHLRAFLGEDLQGTGFIATQDALAAGVLQRLGIAWRPRLSRMVGSESAWAVSAPLVQDGEVSPWRGLEPNYIQTLLDQRSIAALTQARPDPGSPTPGASLLQLLLRHALLRELADAAGIRGRRRRPHAVPARRRAHRSRHRSTVAGTAAAVDAASRSAGARHRRQSDHAAIPRRA